MFTLEDSRAVYILDCHKTQNQVSFQWKDTNEIVFDTLRGPDLLSEGLHEHIKCYLENDDFNEYFEVRQHFKIIMHQLTVLI